LKVNHLSLPRNPDIAQVCFLRGWIEKIGRGTLKIIDDCKDKGLPVPSWHTGSGATTIVFPGVTVTRYTSNKVGDGDNDGDSDGVGAIVAEDLNDGVTEGLIDGVTNGVKLELERVLQVIVSKPGVNASDITHSIGKSKPTTERYISLLRQLGTIERKGVSRTSGYFTSKRTQEKLSGQKKGKR
jgi:ATP-dependent DNA helicase RecG